MAIGRKQVTRVESNQLASASRPGEQLTSKIR